MIVNRVQHNIQAIREELYFGKGYVVLRHLVPDEVIKHLQSFWLHESNFSPRHSFNKYLNIRLNGPDHTLKKVNQLVHYNFFWNRPRDETTYNLAWQLQSFRNEIEGQPIDWGYLPNYYTPGEKKYLRYVSSYRIVNTQNGEAVPLHSDWDLDHSKVQCSLMLSSHGTDYSGGMLLNDQFRGGRPVNISEKENLQAGDLLLFRYAHTHGVSPIKKTNSDLGFVRMLMPVEIVDLREQGFLFRQGKRLKLAGLKTKAKVSRQKPDYSKLLINKGRLVRGQGEDLYYDSEVERLMEIAIREGLPPVHVFLYRGLWGRFNLFRDWQIDILQEYGLQKNHSFLDIGCGILRLGMPLIQFLDTDRYCGIDAIEAYIKLGKVYIQEIVKTDKDYHLIADRHFDFHTFKRQFDFAMAQSVFTHMSFVQIEECFQALKKVMKVGGKLIFTIITNRDHEQNILYVDQRPMTKSSHAGLEFYYNLAKKCDFILAVDNKVKHPTQKVIVATF